jgi:hypothetical protein
VLAYQSGDLADGFLDWEDGFFGRVCAMGGALPAQLIQKLFRGQGGLVVEQFQQRVVNFAGYR